MTQQESTWPYSREDWFSVPLKLRQRWWAETDFSAKEPSAELLAAVNAALGKERGE